MAANNYFGFTATQYGATANATYPANYSVPATANNANYNPQRATGYDHAYQAAPGTYTSTGNPTPTYEYGYGRPAQPYDTSKTYYQQSGTAGYSAQAYDTQSTGTKVPGFQPATYGQAARSSVQPPKTTQYPSNQTFPQPAYSQTVSHLNTAAKTSANTPTYTNYDAALYSAATMYVAQQSNKSTNSGQNTGWNTFSKKNGHQSGAPSGINPGPKHRIKQQPKPQQLHYCEVCKISCAGPQTYREHLEGQKHKRREASLKLPATAANTTQNRGNNLHCELCDVTCTGSDAYAAHVRGSKHQKVVKLHQKLGKPIPSAELAFKQKITFIPGSDEKAADENGANAGAATAANAGATVTPAGATGVSGASGAGAGVASVAVAEEPQTINMIDEIKPVGVEYIEEMKDTEGKILSFNCKLCECKFNDPNAKEMHMKGRRHRLQFKKKVQPDLVVDIKPSPRQKKIAEAKAQRAVMQEEFWNRRRLIESDIEDEEALFWEERRRIEEELDYMNWMQRGVTGPRTHRNTTNHQMFANFSARRTESPDDRHVVARHAEIYPKEEELQVIQQIVSHTERALKFVSDALTDQSGKPSKAISATDQADDVKVKKDWNAVGSKEDGRDNQMFSFQKEAEGSNIRILKGVMRVALLAKGLLLQGDTCVQLVVLCAQKPNQTLLREVTNQLQLQLKRIASEQDYKVTEHSCDSALKVTDSRVTVIVSLTSPLLRETDTINASTNEQQIQCSEELLPREPCLQALAALRHAKWFQARATGLQSCVMIMRILRDLCQRSPSWSPLPLWALELLTEKVISSAGLPLSPGDCLRRVLEAVASGVLISGQGLLDPCEKDPHDVLAGLSFQQREDLTVSAQQFLRFLAFRQIHKILGMDQLPQPKFPPKPWRVNRKRRRSGAEGADIDENQSFRDGKMTKIDERSVTAAIVQVVNDKKD